MFDVLHGATGVGRLGGSVHKIVRAVSYSLSLLDMRTWSALLHWLMKRFLMIVYSQPPRLVESVNFSKLQRAFKKTDCVKSEASSSFLVK